MISGNLPIERRHAVAMVTAGRVRLAAGSSRQDQTEVNLGPRPGQAGTPVRPPGMAISCIIDAMSTGRAMRFAARGRVRMS